MPVYVETQDVTKPAGSRDRSLGDDDIREMKRAECERQNEDHIRPADETGETKVGYHRKSQYAALASDPTVVAGTGIVYTKDVGAGVIELFYRDAAGNVIQLTSGGLINSIFRSGDKILSSNTNTPSGWTDQSGTYNNSFIRISSGTPLTTGGADTHDHGAATGSHTLTTAEMPAHEHDVYAVNGGGFLSGSHTSLADVDVSDSGTSMTATATMESVGGGGGHTHTIASANNVPVYVQMKMYSKT